MSRTLHYVPVIHVTADLGRVAPQVERLGREVVGIERWEEHKRIVGQFWGGIRRFFQAMKAEGVKIYQDGIMEAGMVGLKIIEEGAHAGSSNHLIVLDLLSRGAILQKTEDLDLLLEEYERILRLAQTQSEWDKISAFLGYKKRGEDLLERRDRSMAGRIAGGLKEGECGILFVGAFHDVLSYLPENMEILCIKDPEKVREYFRSLLYGAEDGRFSALAEYMVLPPEMRI